MKNLRHELSSLVRKPVFYFCVCFVLLNLLFTKSALAEYSLWAFIVVAVIEVLVEAAAVFTLYRMRQKGVPIEKQFLFIAIVLGVLFIMLMPPGEAPDDRTHFVRAYSISQGNIMPEIIDGEVSIDTPIEIGYLRVMPSSGTYSEIFENFGNSSDEKIKHPYTAAALYNFVCYIPQTTAILIGKALNMSILGMGYLIKIFNFVVWLVLIYFAIKLIPKLKTAVIFVALLPITLQEATSISPDALTISLSVFMVSFVVYLAYTKRDLIKKKEIILLYMLAALIGLCKIVYLPLTMLYLIIPFERFGSKRRKIIHLLAIVLLVGVINLTWLLMSSRYLVEYNEGVNSSMQLLGIMRNPFNYVMVIFSTLNAHIEFWIFSMLGSNLGAFAFNLPTVISFVSFSVCLLLFAQRVEVLPIKVFDRVIFATVFAVIFGLILTSLYMQWTPVGYETIEGVQGRYFLPILLLVPIMICRSKGKKRIQATLISDKYVLLYTVFLNVMGLIAILSKNI